jgi:hypothetical protein
MAPSHRWRRDLSGAVASAGGLCETGTSPPGKPMKKTGSEMPSPDDSSGGTGNEASAEIIERVRLQADVAQQRVRLAKDELRRARKRLKEAKREAKRARKRASSARKDWKRARRQAKKDGANVGAAVGRQQPKKTTKRGRKSRMKLAAARTRRAQSRSSGKRGRRTSRARAGK